MVASSSFAIHSGPFEMQGIYGAAYAAALEAGADDPEAGQLAYRQLHQAGFYQTKDGWQQLGPDLRGKVNIRPAEQQPDGSFMVRDVDVFYPNAVKGADPETQWTPDRVNQAIENTNHAINSGGQPPAVTRTHVYPEQKMLGVHVPSQGKAINWRESPRGGGWARADLVSVHPDVVEDWKKGAITGMSAGFVKDAGNLNERFGHVALLGGESQALAALPMTEVYSADQAVCFSTDPNDMQFASTQNPGNLAGPKANVDPNLKTQIPSQESIMRNMKNATQMKDAYSGLSAAYAAFEAGEPDADKKITEAEKALHSAQQYMAPQPPGAMGGGGPAPMGGPQAAPAPPPPSNNAYNGQPAFTGSQEPHETTYLPQAADTQMHDITPTTTEPAAPPATNRFGAAPSVPAYSAPGSAQFAAPGAQQPAAPYAHVPHYPQPNQNFAAQPVPSAPAARQDQNFSAQLAQKDGQIQQLQLAVAALTGRQMRTDFSSEVQNLIGLGHQIDLPASVSMFEACAGDNERIKTLLALLRTAPKSALSAAGTPTFSALDAGKNPPVPGAPAGAPGTQPSNVHGTEADVLAILRSKMPHINYTAEDVALGTLAFGANGANGQLSAFH
jgi:hypothetical protein